jgi:hypothetical protein
MYDSTPVDTTYKNIITISDKMPDLGISRANPDKVYPTQVLRVSCPKCGLLDKVLATDTARLRHLDHAHAKCATRG